VISLGINFYELNYKWLKEAFRMYTPIKRTKANDALLHNLEQLIREGVTRIGLKPSQFQLLHDSICEPLKVHHIKEIPYEGAIIYKLEPK
jgi:hypothetical protein